MWHHMGDWPYLVYYLWDWDRILPKGSSDEGLYCQKAGSWVDTCRDQEGVYSHMRLIGIGQLAWIVPSFSSLGAWDACVHGVRHHCAEWGLARTTTIHCIWKLVFGKSNEKREACSCR